MLIKFSFLPSLYIYIYIYDLDVTSSVDKQCIYLNISQLLFSVDLS